MSRPASGARGRRLGQSFLTDPNLLDLIVREADLDGSEVVLEIGGGAGALTERLRGRVSHLHVVEVDERLRPELEPLAGPGVSLHWGDAMRLDLSELDPLPDRIVANLPYSIATPLIIKTIEELPSVERWLVMVQREIADRLRAGPGSKVYGAPSVLVGLACDVSLVRAVGREVFRPAPRVDSALLRLTRRKAAAAPALRSLVRAGFAHRRKALARSVDLVEPGAGPRVRAALLAMGLREDSRAEMLSPGEFAKLVALLR